MKRMKVVVVALLALIGSAAVVNCGGSFFIGGTVSGLVGQVILQCNGANDLTVTENGAFEFSSKFSDGTSYAVTVLTHPDGQTCTIANGSGTISGSNIDDVEVTCAESTYTIGGTVSGLSGTVVLQNNGGDDLTVTQNGSFTFSEAVADGSSYAVTVLTQPTDQTCTVANGSGTVGGANITSVTVTCAETTYTVGGTVSGLDGVLVLRNNGGIMRLSPRMGLLSSIPHSPTRAHTM